MTATAPNGIAAKEDTSVVGRTAPPSPLAAATSSSSSSSSLASSSASDIGFAVGVGRDVDIFELGRRATAARDARLGARASFTRSRQLLATGAWRGPRDATESYVEVTDLPAEAGFTTTTASSGVGLLVGGAPLQAHRDARTHGARTLWRFSFRSGESAEQRQTRLVALRDLSRQADLSVWGVMPTPEGEAEGLDTLRLVAMLRLAAPEIPHVVLDVALLGPRLAQMALGFGGDELWAPIVSERALRLGGNANNPAMTRKEAAILIRGAGLVPCERLTPDTYREETE